jgi:hypothetical protein
MSAHTHGCCDDKACSEKTCMELPDGKTCGDCRNFRHCAAFYAHKPTDTYCDFFPRRFAEPTHIEKATNP